MTDATIYALGTPTPLRAHPGAISVIRLSGPQAAEALVALTGKATLPEPTPERLERIRDQCGHHAP